MNGSMYHTPQFNKDQSAILDLIRFFAAFLVLGAHLLTHFYDTAYYPYRQHYYTNLGSIGLGIFFVLSGFLIAFTVTRKQTSSKTYSFEIYLIERLTRLYIVLIPALLIALTLNMMNDWLALRNDVSHFTFKHFIVTALMLQGIRDITAHGETFALIEPAWSLNYEFYLYIIFGLIALKSSSASGARDWLIRSSLFILTIGIALRLDHLFYYAYNWLIGVIVAGWFVHGFRWRATLWNVTLVASIMTAHFATSPQSFDGIAWWVFPALYGVCIYGLLLWFDIQSVPNVVARLAKRLSSYAYTMYLIHYGIIHIALLMCLKYGILPGNSETALLRFAIVIFLMISVNLLSYGLSLITEQMTGQAREQIIRLFKKPIPLTE